MPIYAKVLLTALVVLLVLMAGVVLVLWIELRGNDVAERLKSARDLQEIDLLAQLAHAQAQWEETEGKLHRTQALIGGILKEKDDWKALYFDQVTCHGNAQEMMMGGIAYLHEALRRAGIEIQVPPVLNELRQDFIQKHEIPVQQELGTPKIGNSVGSACQLEDAPPPVTESTKDPAHA